MNRVTAFRWVPPFAQGLVRDLRVRWALEEAGLPYEARLIGPEDQGSASYRRLQPFGQVPAYEEDGLAMFESGAIVLHIAERSEALMPADPVGRARAQTWMFAALDTVQSAIMSFVQIELRQVEGGGAETLRAAALDFVRLRLRELEACLGEREFLEDRFTAGDLLMATVLDILRGTDLLREVPALDAYRQRCKARPAYQRALAGQMAAFAENVPPGE
ncbi:MAG TPA: glutathione S-transferase family protein [Acetobacteraceae bacterium]|nr:glutathione S-transferase family protein [Acetobacteraceae bacterium]